MSVQEIRNDIIRENLPKLLKLLTGFEDEDENLRRCENFAVVKIRNHRNLSVNSHEVRRRIEGMKEKFVVDNNAEYADYLGRLCDAVTSHPVCLEHYELDVHWGLLDFLLSLSYNPTGALKHNKHTFNISEPVVEEEDVTLNQALEDWKNELRADLLPVQRYSDSDSSLSEWSEDAEDVERVDPIEIKDSTETKDEPKAVVLLSQFLQPLRPPEKETLYAPFSSVMATEDLETHVQHTWWLEEAGLTQEILESTRLEANFAQAYNAFLNGFPYRMARRDEPSTMTEHLAMREILWMFHKPMNCKLFVSDAKGFRSRKDVTLPSVTENSLCQFVEHHFVNFIIMMNTARSYIHAIYRVDECNPPKTVESYAANLNSLLEPVWQKLLNFERRLVQEKDYEINTLLTMQQYLQPSLKLLENIFDIHQQVGLSVRHYPPHITSTYALASLWRCYELTGNRTKAHLAMALFMTSVRKFCTIVDTWWREGCLDDWRNEFIVERTAGDQKQRFKVREFKKNRAKALFIPKIVTKVIEENAFYRLLHEHCLEAGLTLNLLYEINRIRDVKNASVAIGGDLYDVFIEGVLEHVRALQTSENVDGRERNDSITSASKPSDGDVVDAPINESDYSNCGDFSENISDHLTTTDEFLLLVFNASSGGRSGDTKDAGDSSPCPVAATDLRALEIFELLERSSQLLPLDEIIMQAMERLLRVRLTFAHEFVLGLYMNEYELMKHLRNIRRVLFFEASDMMYQFYSSLFKKIESGRSWAQEIPLTMELNSIICSHFPDMASLFNITLKSAYECQTTKVSDAVNHLQLSYQLGHELSLVIAAEDIDTYNQVFRFLLKIKWAVTTLENLRYPSAYKKRPSFSPARMVDLLMRRLELLRFWLTYAMQALHFHLMTHVLQSMGEQLELKLGKAQNIQEIVEVHRSFLRTVLEHCMLIEDFLPLRLAIDQLINLVLILRLEWSSCSRYLETQMSPLSYEGDGDGDEEELDCITQSQIDTVESTYVRCHQFLAKRLKVEVYEKHHAFLTGLKIAFHENMPY